MGRTRRRVLAEGFRELAPDLVALQETAVGDGYDQVTDVLGESYHLAHQTERESGRGGDVEDTSQKAPPWPEVSSRSQPRTPPHDVERPTPRAPHGKIPSRAVRIAAQGHVGMYAVLPPAVVEDDHAGNQRQILQGATATVPQLGRHPGGGLKPGERAAGQADGVVELVVAVLPTSRPRTSMAGVAPSGKPKTVQLVGPSSYSATPTLKEGQSNARVGPSPNSVFGFGVSRVRWAMGITSTAQARA